jgi:hypothetical protein
MTDWVGDFSANERGLIKNRPIVRAKIFENKKGFVFVNISFIVSGF